METIIPLYEQIGKEIWKDHRYGYRAVVKAVFEAIETPGKIFSFVICDHPNIGGLNKGGLIHKRFRWGYIHGDISLFRYAENNGRDNQNPGALLASGSSSVIADWEENHIDPTFIVGALMETMMRYGGEKTIIIREE